MKQFLLFIIFAFVTQIALSQPTDFIVLKKRNGRPLKSYFPGVFISAETYNGFNINGYIKDIRNDSIIILQQERRLRPTEFGSTLDTLAYTFGIDYHLIKKFHFTRQYTWGRKRGFTQVTLPALLIAGGTGFILLETVNSAYRHESLTADGKMKSFAIAGGAALAGFAMTYFHNRSDKAGGKYRVIYVKNHH